MGLLQQLGWSNSAQTPSTELPDIFPFPVLERDFIGNDIQNLYARILTDVLERTQGISDEQQVLLWDNCLGNESSEGLVTLIAKAMLNKAKLFLIYDSGVKVIRKATSQEQAEIERAYKDGKQAPGIYITFENYTKTDMLRIYSALEYCTTAGLYKSGNISKAVQVKINDLRASVSITDSSKATTQGSAIATALKNGKDVLLDAKDIIETAKPDLTAVNASIEFIDNKRSLILGLPATYINGESSKGLGDSGEGDAKQVERGLKPFYFSIIKPVAEELFGVKTTFKSENYAGIASANETLKTFEITDDEYLSADNKRLIINRMYGLPDDEKGGPKEKPEPTPKPTAPVA